MSASRFCGLLDARSSLAELTIEASHVDQLEAYFNLLQRWNRTINLTALPLEPLTTDAVDRLFIEPLAAAQLIRSGILPAATRQSPGPLWFDLGSGGGSPAIPMKIALATARLTLIESRSRKVAFLREVVRLLDLRDVVVEEGRVDQFVARANAADLVTVRGVRLNDVVADSAAKLLREDGVLTVFQSVDVLPQLTWFSSQRSYQLVSGQPSWLHVYRRLRIDID